METTLKLKQHGEEPTGTNFGRRGNETGFDDVKVEHDAVSSKVTSIFDSNKVATSPQSTTLAESSHATPTRSPPVAEVASRLPPGGEPEAEAPSQQPTRDHAATLEDQLGLGPQQPRPDFEHPPRRLAEVPHELGVGQRLGRGDVARTRDLLVLDQPVDRTDEVGVVDPRDVLPAVAGPSPESATDEPQERIEDGGSWSSPSGAPPSACGAPRTRPSPAPMRSPPRR